MPSVSAPSVATASVDPNIVCPVSKQPLFLTAGRLVTQDGRDSYECDGDILMLRVAESRPEETVTSTVQDFYTDSPFPNYNEFDDIETFVQSADRSIFASMLRQEIPINAAILEVGCGTAQMSNFLAATTMSRVYATDLTPASLRLGSEFARKHNIHGVKFIQMNLFRPCIRPESMDLVIANGVLHHTYDTRAAFHSIAPLVKPGGYILVGLYNHIGRLRTDLRRVLYRTFGDSVLRLDPQLRRQLSADKRRAWIRDQYLHPQERKHSLSQVLAWFRETGFDFVSSIPRIGGRFMAEDSIFAPRDSGTGIDRVLAEIAMLFTTFGGEGGLFIVIGQRKERSGGNRPDPV